MFLEQIRKIWLTVVIEQLLVKRHVPYLNYLLFAGYIDPKDVY